MGVGGGGGGGGGGVGGGGGCVEVNDSSISPCHRRLAPGMAISRALFAAPLAQKSQAPVPMKTYKEITEGPLKPGDL